MIVKVADYLSSIGGSVDKDHWLRPLKDRPGYASLCRKPRYSKKEKQMMQQKPSVQQFADLMAKAQAIYHDPAQRAEWEQKHIAALQEASKHQHVKDARGHAYVPRRLWDYIKRELAK